MNVTKLELLNALVAMNESLLSRKLTTFQKIKGAYHVIFNSKKSMLALLIRGNEYISYGYKIRK